MIRISFLLFLFISSHLSAQNPLVEESTAKKNKSSLYFTWGYNKDWFSRSDLNFHSAGNDSYDFTIHNVKAKDRPNLDQIFQKDFTIPQFVYRLGYFFKNSNWGIELGFDHAKYIMVTNQVARVTGTIDDVYIDKDTILSPYFVKFEHTNGANFLMASLIYKKQLLQSKSNYHRLQGLIKPGAGIVIPQSDISLFGKSQSNNYHVAGYIFGCEADFRYELGKHLFIETGFKGVFANYTNVLTIAESRANHHFFALEWIGGIGYSYSF